MDPLTRLLSRHALAAAGSDDPWLKAKGAIFIDELDALGMPTPLAESFGTNKPWLTNRNYLFNFTHGRSFRCRWQHFFRSADNKNFWTSFFLDR